jgi:hypothetical protein
MTQFSRSIKILQVAAVVAILLLIFFPPQKYPVSEVTDLELYISDVMNVPSFLGDDINYYAEENTTHFWSSIEVSAILWNPTAFEIRMSTEYRSESSDCYEVPIVLSYERSFENTTHPDPSSAEQLTFPGTDPQFSIPIANVSLPFCTDTSELVISPGTTELQFNLFKEFDFAGNVTQNLFAKFKASATVENKPIKVHNPYMFFRLHEDDPYAPEISIWNLSDQPDNFGDIHPGYWFLRYGSLVVILILVWWLLYIRYGPVIPAIKRVLAF